MSTLFLVDEDQAEPAAVTTLGGASLREREHLQQWIIANPSILGEGVRIVCEEYDRWVAEIDGVPARDRLDLLGIDKVGRLVVVELKRGMATRDVHLQAITYAALVSRFTLATLAQAHAAFLSRGDRPRVSEAEAREQLVDHVEGEIDPAILKRPRQVLIASSFPKQVTNSAVYLSEQGLDISLIQVTLWTIAGRHVAEFSTLYPTPVEAEFTLTPRRQEADAVSERIEQRSRSKNVAHLLVDAGLPPAGTRFHVVPAHGTTAAIRDRMDAWMAEKDARRWVTWRNDRSKPVCWQEDGASYSATGLAELIFTKVEERAASGIQGTAWFVLDDETCPEDVDPGLWSSLQGKSLVEIAQIVATSPPRRAPIIDRLVDAEELTEGEPLHVVVPRVDLDCPAIENWLLDEPGRGQVTWRNDRDKPLRWSYDQGHWGMRDLVSEIVRLSLGVETRKVWGPRWFATADGRTLNKIADDVDGRAEN